MLSGKANFTGRLPFTVAQKEDDYPEFKYIGQKPYEIEYGYYHGYTKLDKEGKQAAYPFGYGLSYTSFSMENIHVGVVDGVVTVTASVKNTGKVSGTEVVQVYAGSQGTANGDDRPVKLLKGFQQVELKAGEEKTMEITIPVGELQFWTPGGWVLDHSYNVYVGTDAQNAMMNCQTIELASA